MPLHAQVVDIKEEIMKIDMATMPQYADAHGDYLLDKQRWETNERVRKAREQSSASETKDNEGGSGGGFSGIDFSPEWIIPGCAITAFIVGGICVIASFFLDSNLIMSGPETN
jgi:hypothetical protein